MKLKRWKLVYIFLFIFLIFQTNMVLANNIVVPHEWYRYQGASDSDKKGNDCGPTCVAMAIQFIKNTFVPIRDIRNYIGHTGDTTSEKLKDSLQHWGISYNHLSAGSQNVIDAVNNRNHIVICPVAMLQFNPGNDIDGKSDDPALHYDRYCSFTEEHQGHFIVVKGISDDGNWIIVYDPGVWRSYPDPKYWYSNGEPKGKERYYKLSEFSNAINSRGIEILAEPHPIITSSLKIIPSLPYCIEDTINAEFSITNENATPITFTVLTVGGRDPDNHVSDFTHRQNISLEPSKSYDYKGILTLNKVGDYHFFCTYQTPDGEWNTNIDVGSKLTDEDREEDIYVEEKIVNQPPDPPANLAQFESDGEAKISIGGKTDGHNIILKGKLKDPDGDKARLEVEIRRLNEYGGQFDEDAGGLKQSDLFENNSEIMLPVNKLADGDYHWRARAIDEHDLASEWVSFGGNPDSTIDFTVGQEAVTPVITSPLKITTDSPYYVGDTINAEFTITNQSLLSIKFSVLTVGGRDPDDYVSDFTHRQNISLEPSKSYNYQGVLDLNKVGNYHFFCTYQTPDGNWNTNVNLGSGLADEGGTEDIIVEEKEKPSMAPTISEELYIEWDKTFGGSYDDWVHSFIQNTDGGYALVGSTRSRGAVKEDAWVIILEDDGYIVWDKTFGGNQNDTLTSFIQNTDSSYMLAGFTNSNEAAEFNAWVIKLDDVGNIIWDKTFGGSEKDGADSLIQTSDNGYAVVGSTSSKGKGKYDVWVIKLDDKGNMEWDKTFGGNDDDRGSSLIQTTDGGYAIAGSTFSKGAGERDAWVIKLDDKGNMEWDKTFGGIKVDGLNSLIQTSDSSYILAGFTNSNEAGEFNAWVIKLDDDGNTVWDKTFGGSKDDGLNSLIQTSDNGYAVVGSTSSKGKGKYDAWVIKLDDKGNMEWDKTFGGNDDDRGSSLIQTTDGGYAIAGSTSSKGAGECDVWVIKLSLAVSEDAQVINAFLSPSEIIESFIKAINEGDLVSAEKYVAPDIKLYSLLCWDWGDESQIKSIEYISGKIQTIEIKGEKIEDDKATVVTVTTLSPGAKEEACAKWKEEFPFGNEYELVCGKPTFIEGTITWRLTKWGEEWMVSDCNNIECGEFKRTWK